MTLSDRLFGLLPDRLIAAAPPISNLPSSGGNGGVPAGGQPVGGGGSGGGFGLLLPMMLMIFMLLIVMQVLGGRKEKKRRAEMMSSLRKHDRVRMLGGIIGSVAEIHDDELVIKVDEATNTRIRFAKDAVQTVLRSAAGAAPSEPEKVE